MTLAQPDKPIVVADSSGSVAADAETKAVSRRMRWARPLRVHLSVIIVVLLVAISVPLMWLTYHQGRESAIASAEQQMRLLSRNTIDLYENVFRQGHSLITVGAVVPSLAAEPPEFLDANRDFFVRALRTSPHIDGIYVGYPNGAFVQVVNVEHNPEWRSALSAPDVTVFAMRVLRLEPDGGRSSSWRFLDRDGGTIEQGPGQSTTFDPRRRPWFRAARNADGPVSIGPYTSATTNSLTLSLAVTMAEGSGAVLSADILVEAISRMLAEQAISPNSSGFVFDEDDRLIVHSDPAIMEEIVQSLTTKGGGGEAIASGDAVLQAVAGLVRGDDPDENLTIDFDVGGEPYLARVSSVGFSRLLDGHQIVIAAPLSDFTGPAEALLRKTLAIAGILVLSGIVLAIVVARRISRTLAALTADATRIGDLDFDGRRRIYSWITEINTLGGALAAARDAIWSFAVYVPRELVRQIVASGQAAAGQAVRREVTVLFTDIKDFTTISEVHPPEEVVEILSVYFEVLNKVVQSHNGVIVQYLGDSIYAMWNAPTENPDHVDDGCRCAIELKAAIAALNRENLQAGKPELVTRFGLHTGPAVVGSVGAEARRQYTAMGDTVNVASRLEGMNKQFDTTILASAAIVGRCRAPFTFRSLGLASAKGRFEPIEIYELSGTAEPAAGDATTPGGLSADIVTTV